MTSEVKPKRKVSGASKVFFTLLASLGVLKLLHLDALHDHFTLVDTAYSSETVQPGTADVDSGTCVRRQGVEQEDGTCACGLLFSGPRCEDGDVHSFDDGKPLRRLPAAFTGDIVRNRMSHRAGGGGRDQPISSRMPGSDPLRNDPLYQSCAVVGTSGALLGLGAGIDGHDLVLRVGEDPTADFSTYVGSKTSVRLVNAWSARPEPRDEMLLADPRHWRQGDWAAYNRAAGGPEPRGGFYVLSAEFARYAEETLEELGPSLEQPGALGADRRAGDAPSLELTGLLVAVNVCREVTLYMMVAEGSGAAPHSASAPCDVEAGGRPSAKMTPGEKPLLDRLVQVGLARHAEPCLELCRSVSYPDPGQPGEGDAAAANELQEECDACRKQHQRVYYPEPPSGFGSGHGGRGHGGAALSAWERREAAACEQRTLAAALASSTPGAKASQTTPLSPQALKERGVDLDGWVKSGKAAKADVHRRAAVKKAMEHAWGSYSKYAWGMDELKPISQHGHNGFGGMGLTIIDSLDTLYIMGLHSEFRRAKEWVLTNMTFDHLSNTQECYRKQVQCRQAAKTDKQLRECGECGINTFETIIRYVGGFMSAYDLSGERVFVDKCVELAERLMSAFATPTGVPLNLVDFRNRQIHGSAVGTEGFPVDEDLAFLAEFGTMQLEYVALSHRTGDDRYAKLAENVIRQLHAHPPTRGMPRGGRGLFPTAFSPRTASWMPAPRLTFGGMGDSFYEYLVKAWVQGGRSPALHRYRDMFAAAMEGMKNVLVGRSASGKLTFVGEWTNEQFIPKMDHLTCFVPGVLVLGAEGAEAAEYLQLAQQIATTCVEMYFRQPTGIAPEGVVFPDADAVNKGRKQEMEASPAHNLLRPETVESLLLLYRKTGDPIYREWGWRIFEAFEKHARTPHGYSGLRNVTERPSFDSWLPDAHRKRGGATHARGYTDNMESFFLAETLKYLYLLFDDTSHVPLDEWVFTTEAHPLKIFKREYSYVNDNQPLRKGNPPTYESTWAHWWSTLWQ